MNEHLWGDRSKEDQEWSNLTKAEKAAEFKKIHDAFEASGRKRDLPSISQVLKQAKRAAATAHQSETKIRRLQFYIHRLEVIIEKTSIEFEKRLKEGAIDDPNVFYNYLDEARLAARTLTLKVEELSIPTETPPPGNASVPDPSPVSRSTRSHSTDDSGSEVIAEGFIDKKQAAAHLKISARSLSNYLHFPDFPAYRTDRRLKFKKSELDAWRAQHRNGITMDTRQAKPILSMQKARTVPEHLARLLVDARHIDEASGPHLVEWMVSGGKARPEGEYINWLTGRKTLCTFIVCAYHASLLPFKTGTKKSGKSGPLYEKAIISAFLNDGARIRPGIDRTIAGPEGSIVRFADIMNKYNQSSEDEPQEEGTLFANIDDYFFHRSASNFEPYYKQLKEEFMVGDRKTFIFTEIEESVLKLFSKLYKDCSELLS
jgi:hypothetical protein